MEKGETERVKLLEMKITAKVKQFNETLKEKE
jgi:hypothetical protein